jgi:hypothetical protein
MAGENHFETPLAERTSQPIGNNEEDRSGMDPTEGKGAEGG